MWELQKVSKLATLEIFDEFNFPRLGVKETTLNNKSSPIQIVT